MNHNLANHTNVKNYMFLKILTFMNNNNVTLQYHENFIYIKKLIGVHNRILYFRFKISRKYWYFAKITTQNNKESS